MQAAANRPIVWRAGLPAAAILAAAYGFWCLADPGAPGQTALGLGGVFASFVLAAVSAVRAARSAEGGRGSRVWRVLATGLLLWAIASAVGGASWLLRGSFAPKPSVADLLHLAGGMSILWAMSSYPVSPPERFGRVRELLDVAILTLSVLALFWLSLLRPVLQALRVHPVQLFWAGLRPALDAVFIALVLRVNLLASRPAETRPALFLGAASLAFLIGDLLMGYQDLVDGYVPGTSLDLAWMVGGLAVTWSALQVAPMDRWPAASATGAGRRRVEALLPIAFTYAVVGFTLLDASMSGSIDPAGLAISVALSVLLVARQGVVTGQSEMRQYASLLNASGDLAFICESDGDLRFFNPAFVAALSLEGSGPKRFTLADFMTGSDVQSILAQARSDGWTGEVYLRRWNGTSFPAVVTLRPVESGSGSGTFLAGTGVDLTGIKARETELRSALHDVAAARAELQALNVDLERKVEARTEQLAKMVAHLDRLNKELKELDKLKSEFVALVSHELRAPLTNIRSGLELLLAGNPSLDRPARESLALVEEEAARLGRFVEAILDLSALEAGKSPLQPGPVSLEKVARLAIDRFRGHPAHAQIRLAFGEGLPDVLADEQALGSVFFHLLDNAAKYGGTGLITLSARARQTLVEVDIQDSGPGIPEAERERIFEMFHRLDSRDDREVYGHGLGLHLVRRMLQSMGGSIRAESGATGGAKMVFTLPRADVTPGVEDLAAEGSPARV